MRNEHYHCAVKRYRDQCSLKKTSTRVGLKSTQSNSTTSKGSSAKSKNPLTSGKVLVLPLSISKTLGKSAALFLQQLHYWTGRGQGANIGGLSYVYNTYDGWFKNFDGALSVSSIRRAVVVLSNAQLIEVRQLGGCHRINYYRINYDNLNAHMEENDGLNATFHEFKMNSPCAHFEQMYIDTKITNLNKTNKSSASAFKNLDNFSDLKKDFTTESQIHSPSDFIQKFDVTASKTDLNLSKDHQSAIKQTSANDLPLGNLSTTAADLLKIWNETVGQITHTAALTRDRARYLVKAFMDKFDSNIEKWTTFCKALTTSDFLMGKVTQGFKATIDWVLKFSNLQKIFEGAYGVKYEVNDTSGDANAISETLSIEEYHDHIEAVAVDEFDVKCQKKVLSTMVKNGDLKRYHYSFYKVAHSFKSVSVEMMAGMVKQIICTTVGYVPFYEESFKDLLCNALYEVLGEDKPLCVNQVEFVKG